MGQKASLLLNSIFRFDNFEANRESYYLRSDGRTVRLERIPLELLFLLLERCGKLVEREEIVARLWRDISFMDTERSINTAIRKIRKALGDNPKHPKFIDTVVGKGYRFIAPVILESKPGESHGEPHAATAEPANSGEIRLREFSLTSGAISHGTGDENDGGTFKTSSFTGTVSAVNSLTGRATVTIQSSLGAAHEVIYVVSTGEMVIANTDSNGPPIQAGQVLQQSGTFTNASLNGAAVLYAQDIHNGNGYDQSSAGIFTFDGKGHDNVIAMDEDKAGTIQQDQPSQGTYSVAANGAVTFTCQGGGCPAGFLVSQNKAMFVGTGSNSLFGMMEPQTGAPFSDASISGSYAGGSLPPLDYLNANNEIDAGSADGKGTLVVSGDSSGSGGLDQNLGTNVTYNIASNGRGTAEAQGDNAPSIVYLISPTKFVVLQPKTDARGLMFTH